jgi:hypothetical protein
MTAECIFCEIIAGRAAADIVCRTCMCTSIRAIWDLEGTGDDARHWRRSVRSEHKAAESRDSGQDILARGVSARVQL